MAGPSRRGRGVGFEVVYEGGAAVGVAYEAAAVDIEEFGGGVVIDAYLPTRKNFLAGYNAVFSVTLLKNCRTGFNGQNCACAE